MVSFSNFVSIAYVPKDITDKNKDETSWSKSCGSPDIIRITLYHTQMLRVAYGGPRKCTNILVMFCPQGPKIWDTEIY